MTTPPELKIQKTIAPELRQVYGQHIRLDEQLFRREGMTSMQTADDVAASTARIRQYEQDLSGGHDAPPLVVIEAAPGDLVLVNGYEQWAAARNLTGARRLPCYVYTLDHPADLDHVVNINDIFPAAALTKPQQEEPVHG